MACSSIARCAGAHACWRSLSARVRASINVARSVCARISSADLGAVFRPPWAARRFVEASSCCASTDLLSQPRAIFVRPVLRFPRVLSVGSPSPYRWSDATWRARPHAADLACTARCLLGVHCTLPTWRALHAAYLACATARSAGGTAIRSGCAATCDLTISSACATAPASPARYTELASIRVFCDAGVESGLS